MDYAARFVVDRCVADKAYPNISTWQAEPYTKQWREFGQHWPFSVPVELFEHCRTHNVPVKIYTSDQDFPWGCFYPIGLGFFDFSIDYIALLPPVILQSIKQHKLRLLFYYHEGDNPRSIKERLDFLCQKHEVRSDCYKFVSGNTIAGQVKNFIWFADHELLYWHRNRNVSATPISDQPRPFTFTALNRTHKWWRATIMSDLWRQGFLDRAQWSYRTDIDCGDKWEDNPIEIDTLDLRETVRDFLKGCPYTCDSTNIEQQNDHHRIDQEHYTQSYFSLILETHYDADGSKGAFLTEKIFKAIKHGHPFLVAGCANTLWYLRQLGYRTFDHAINNAYDGEIDNTKRYLLLRQSIRDLLRQDLHKWFGRVKADVEHNQRLFLECKSSRVNILLDKLNT